MIWTRNGKCCMHLVFADFGFFPGQTLGINLEINGSQPELILLHKGHQTMFRDIFGGHN